MKFVVSIFLFTLTTSSLVQSWTPLQRPRVTTRLSASEETPDYAGKTIYQRTFYRLTPGSSVSKPNALVLEERLRFQADPNNPGYILPKGPRTFLLREGTHEDEITQELYRVDLGTTAHNGPGTMDTTIATILFLASNPELVQGDILQLACEDGSAGILGCLAAKFALDPVPKSPPVGGPNEELDIVSIPPHEDIFPPRMRQLTLAEEDPEGLQAAYDVAKGFSKSQVNLREVRWSNRVPGRRYDKYYRLIVGSDIDFSYPSSKELARTIANYLLPSNDFVLASMQDGTATGSSSSSFGALGMDMGEAPPAPGTTDPDKEVDPKIPPTFAYVCPDTREVTTYLRQFLEKGFKMTVTTGYLKMERLQFVFQTLPEDAPESDLNKEDLELKDERFRSYQTITAIHSPDYSGEGSGEYFFPLETGEYEGGSRSTYLEPEEGGSPW